MKSKYYYPSKAQLAALMTALFSFGLIPFAVLDFRILSEVAILIGVFLSINYHRGIFKIKGISLISMFFIPIFIFAVAWIIGIFHGHFLSNNLYAIDDSRRYLGLLGLIIFSSLSREDEWSINRLAINIGVFSAVLLTFQLATGWRIFAGTKGFMENGIGGYGFESVVRGSAEGGNYLIAFLFFYTIGNLSNPSIKPNKLKLFIFLTLSIVGLIATFSRGIWVGLLLALIFYILTSVDKIKAAIKSVFLVIASFSVLMIVALIFFPTQLEATFFRAASFVDEGGRGTSLGARFDENRQALESISLNPLFGLGHGGEYKKTSEQIERGFVNEQTFVHNAYLWILVKFGIFGFISVVFFIFKFLDIAWKLRKSDVPIDRITAKAAFATMIVILVNGITSPIWAQSSDLVAFSLLTVLLCTSNQRFAKNMVIRKSL